MKDLSGQTAFVTGAASGIGLGIATALSRARVKVMAAALRKAQKTSDGVLPALARKNTVSGDEDKAVRRVPGPVSSLRT